MGIFSTFAAMPTEEKLMIGGAVVGVGVVGYLAFRKNSSSSSSQAQVPMTGTSTSNGPNETTFVINVPKSQSSSTTKNITNDLDDDDDDDEKKRHKGHRLHPLPPERQKNHFHEAPPAQHEPPVPNGGPKPPQKGGAHYNVGYIAHGTVSHPLHSAVIGSKRPVRV